MTRVIGLDLSIAATGVCLPNGQLTSIRPQGKGDSRLVAIEDAITYYVGACHPDVAVVEEVPPSMRGGTITIVRLGLVHGVARAALARARVPVVYVTASKLKKYATGSGAAGKQQMIDAAFDAGRRPADSDEADAFWCHAAGRHHYDRKPPSVAHALALEVVSGPRSGMKWPELLP